ncbi:MAG: hypothetical protein GH158_01970 [Dehalococcoidia bacterium]|nr:hypothetical protein [Dehalococcoidia bacterium]
MEWQVVVALVLAIPVILIPVAFIWYLNIGGVLAVLTEAREKRAARKKEVKAEAAVSHAEVKH